ncbi:MAG: TIGR00159 family protein [Calditrichaeota bacterium]|nr:MAG: TIGR00159 family protein [Calditrichota bacterium]
MELFKLDFLSVTFFDLLDIALVSFIFYKLFIILRGTRAYQMFIGFVVLLSFSFLAEATQLKGMTWLIDNIRAVWVVVFVILFQAELRRFLIYLGQSKLVTSFLKHEITNFMDALLEALENLSNTKTGALIVFEKDTGLKAIIETGLTLRADITKELLISIFNKNSPLHDGAVVIRDNLVEAATCFLPLTQNPNLPHELGTRHRAGIGVTEESDALVLIVSEETGKISMASNGILSRDLTIKEVKENLQKELSNLN